MLVLIFVFSKFMVVFCIYLMNFCFFYSFFGNKGLCGVLFLFDCLLFWGKNGLFIGGKVVFGLVCLFLLVVLLFGMYYCCVWSSRNDYDFGLFYELMCKFFN